MNIGRQWEDRLRIWSNQFEKYYITSPVPLEVSYFTTMEQLSYDVAVQREFSPAPVGTKWGKKWEYGWFHTTITIPDSMEGKRVVFTLNTAEEMLVWVNGQEAGAIDKQHKFITLSQVARTGTVYDIYAECYAGHGPRMEGAGPCGIHDVPVPEPAPLQVTLGQSFYAIWNEDVFQVAMDYKTLYELAKKLPDKSLRTMKIVEGLKKFTYIADFELSEEELTASLLEADKVLKPLLECKNGSTAVDYTIFGQSHLDLAWLWPVEETLRKTARTYSNQLALMEEYKDYQFFLCEPPIIECLKELYPNVYERVMDKVKTGAIHPDGAVWIESDTNIPSGESLIRQFARGKRWFRDELGVDSQMAWLPDTFGFSAVLPQIMKKCHVPYFATQKLTRQDPEAETFPYNLFWWEGNDGSRVLSHLFKKNNAVFNSGDLITRWEEDRVQQEEIDGYMYPFGYGDGGGGPTREMIEIANRCEDLEGAPRCHMEAPVKFFERAKKNEIHNTYKGELYLAWHRGTLTSQSRTKRGIRKAEVMLKLMEYHMACRMIKGQPIEKAWKEKLEELWQLLLFNQFHDIAPGSSIHRVHERAEAELWKVISAGEELLKDMLGDVTDESVVNVYNHLSWPRKYHGYVIPAQGSAVVDLRKETIGNCRADDNTSTGKARLDYEHRGINGCYILSNDYVSFVIDQYGELVSAKIVGDDREYLASSGNKFLMYKDVNTCYDAWEMGSMYENVPVDIDSFDARLEVCEEENGVAILFTRQVHDSTLTQKIFLGNDAKRLDFITKMDWHEKHKLLKVAFPVNVYATEAINEIQFGYLKRPTHTSKQSDKDKYEVSNHRYTVLEDGSMGAAVLNDCKYGVSTNDNEIRLTLLKAPKMPDMQADQGEQEFTYSFYPFAGAFKESDCVREAYELNEPLCLGAVRQEEPAEEEPIILFDSKNVIVDTIKPADTVENALMVRVYETMGMQADSKYTLHPAVKKVVETDMLETEPIELHAGEKLHFGGFEIKTLLLYL